MKWIETQIDDATPGELLRVSSASGTTQGWFQGVIDSEIEWVRLRQRGSRGKLVHRPSVTGVTRPIVAGPVDRLWLWLHRSVVEPDGHAYRLAGSWRARRRFWIEHYDSNGVITYVATARTARTARQLLAGFMPFGIEGDIGVDALIRMVSPGDLAGVMYLAPLRVSHPPDGRIALAATVLFRSASYRPPSARRKPHIGGGYLLTSWPIQSYQPFVTSRYARGKWAPGVDLPGTEQSET